LTVDDDSVFLQSSRLKKRDVFSPEDDDSSDDDFLFFFRFLSKSDALVVLFDS
jgi:hypothetical protein